MASLIFDSALDDLARGQINFEDDVFAVLLVGLGYSADKAAHTRRSDITDEVTGAGYAAALAEVDVVKDLGFDRIDITLGAANWPLSTISAAGAVYFKSRGGAADDDELIAFIDFDLVVVSTNGPFTLSASTLRLQN